MHLRAEYRIDAGKFHKGKHWRLDKETLHCQFFRQAKLLKLLTCHNQCGDPGDGDSRRFGNKGHGPRGPRIHLQNVYTMVLYRELYVHQSTHRQCLGQFARVVTHGLQVLRIDANGWQDAGRIAGVNACFLDVLLNTGNHASRFVGKGVDIKLRRLLEKLIDQHWTVRSKSNRIAHIFFETFLVVDNRHGSSAQYITGTHQNGITNPTGNCSCLLHRGSHAVFGLRDTEIFQQCSKSFAILGQIDRIRRGSDNFHTRILQAHRQIQGCLPAKLHNHSFRLFYVYDVHHIFERQRLEIETIRCVVVGRDGLRIAIDHDRLESGFVQRKRRVAATVVKFNSLANPIRTRPKNHDFAAVGGVYFVFSFVGRIKIWREGFKFSTAGIYALVNGNQAQLFTIRAHFVFRAVGQIGEASIRERDLLESSKKIEWNFFKLEALNGALNFHDLLQLIQKPWINTREPVDL